MPSFLDPPEAPGPLDENTDLYEYLQSAIFFEGRDSDEEEIEELFFVWRAHEETINGGFGQFFVNGSGDGAEEAASGFRRFGLPELADLLDELFDAIGPRPVPDDQEKRLQWLGARFGPMRRGQSAVRQMGLFLAPYNRRYYDVKAAIDAEHEGEGVHWRICRHIESRRTIFFPS
jgi:hypothetical protein